MSPVEFDDLPFSDRSDLTPYLLHLTRTTKADDGYSGLDNLVSILRTGEIWGSTADGYIKGPRKAACLMDVPFASLKHVCTEKNKPRYEPYGVVVSKGYAYRTGARPVLYLSNEECKALNVPATEMWRVVRFEVDDDGGWISWLHEREWRCPEQFKLPKAIKAVLVKTTKDALKLQERLYDSDDFACRPSAILPLDVVCQGLDW